MPRSRPLLVLVTTVALAGAFVAGTAVDGPDRPDRPDAPRLGGTDASPVAAPYAAPGAPVGYADDCATLLEAYVERAVDLVGPWGWGDTSLYRGGPVLLDDLAADGAVRRASGHAGAAKAPASQRATSEESGTNVQESGVDEPDVVKTDGELLVRLDDGVLTTYDVRGGNAPARLGRLALGGAREGELLLAGVTATVVAARPDGTTRMLGVDLGDPAAPVVTTTADYDARLLAARLHGDAVRVVVAAGLPDLAFTHPTRRRTDREALRANRALVRATTIEDWLPTVTEGGATTPLVDCSAVALPDDAAGLDTLAVVGFAAGDPAERTVQGLAAAADVAYFSPDHLYLATSHGSGWGCCFRESKGITAAYDEELAGTTTVHDLELAGTGTTYLASGRVDGAVADRWAMDEQDGVLRLAVGPSQLTGNFNSVLTLEQDGPALVEVGRLDDLGVDEQIKSVRWFDALAVVVTFREVDPLYAVDLSDETAPTLLGELKIPGFSEYLHPLGRNRMIGLGQGPTGTGRGWGAQAGFFDVTDLTAVRQLDVHSYRAGSQALAGQDPRQVTWLPEERTLLTVIADYGRRGQTGYVSMLHLHDRQISNRMIEVEHGEDVAEVRTVPLGDGRVVLVTGSEVSYFEV
ncbi:MULTISPECIES: beta-propeller domain-containing protein [unclassified Nocardioides]|uniref:beta-propeller domain-containing protein n=1 Tax=unclassified Nocardioides TaxID=2615069 RepID=UPI003014231E